MDESEVSVVPDFPVWVLRLF